MRYEVATDIYEGPLSLMVELAKLQLLDVFLVKIQALTAQYLASVKSGGMALDQLAEPLPLFGQLLAMKARLLLPQPAQPQEEEEPPMSLEELKKRLAEYEQFKTVAQVLSELRTLQHDHLTRLQQQEAAGEGEQAETPAGPVEVELVDLMTAFARILEKVKAPIYEVQAETWTVEMKVEELRVLIAVKSRVEFQELFSPEKSKLELVVTFLALLELIRQRVCLAVQERHFGEILVIRRESQESA